MGLLSRFKEIFGLTDKPYVLTHEQRILPKPTVVVETVVVKAKVGKVKVSLLHNEDSLKKISKNQISELASKELGIEINTKLKKDIMINIYLSAQKG